MKRVGLTPHYTDTVIGADLFKIIRTGLVVLPRPRSQMPENGKRGKNQKRHAGQVMPVTGGPVTENLYCTVDFKTGYQKKNNQKSLKPVPETFKTGIK